MRRLLALAFLALWTGAAFAARLYEGAWFQVRYPDGFIASGSLKSLGADQYDSATFRNPSGDVEFYVFSPQVGGEATDLERWLASERIVAAAEAKNKDRIVRWRTFSAADNSYYRSVEETRTGDGQYVTRVFAIKYKDAATLAKFKTAYEDFKRSYVAYGD